MLRTESHIIIPDLSQAITNTIKNWNKAVDEPHDKPPLNAYHSIFKNSDRHNP